MSLAQIESSNVPVAPPAGNTLLAISTIEQAVGLAERICKTNFVPAAYRGKPEETLACILYGSELGIGPMQSLNSIDIVQGSVFLRAQLVQALARSVGGAIDVETADTERAVVLARRPGWSAPKRVEFTWADAQKQGLTGKDQWKKDPAGMLVNRATTRAGKWYFADVLKGLYVEGEDLDSIPATDETVATEPVETFAELAQQRMAALPTVAAPLDVVDVQLPLDASEGGDDYLTWNRMEWANACAGKLGLPEIARLFKVKNYDTLATADAETKTKVYAALVEASASKTAPSTSVVDDDEAPF